LPKSLIFLQIVNCSGDLLLTRHEHEILQEGATRNLRAFSRFLEIAALSSGWQINCQSIASDARIFSAAI
jgi:hypothetical protein